MDQECANRRIKSKPMPSFVYVLATQNPDGRTVTYVGWTLDLERRLAEHNGSKARRQIHPRPGLDCWSMPRNTAPAKAAMRREVVLKRDKKFRALLRG